MNGDDKENRNDGEQAIGSDHGEKNDTITERFKGLHNYTGLILRKCDCMLSFSDEEKVHGISKNF